MSKRLQLRHALPGLTRGNVELDPSFPEYWGAVLLVLGNERSLDKLQGDARDVSIRLIKLLKHFSMHIYIWIWSRITEAQQSLC